MEATMTEFPGADRTAGNAASSAWVGRESSRCPISPPAHNVNLDRSSNQNLGTGDG